MRKYVCWIATAMVQTRGDGVCINVQVALVV